MDKKTAQCLYMIMRAFGVRREKALEALFVLRGTTVKELSHRTDVSLQFVREWIRGKKSSRNLDRVAGELLFGDPSFVMDHNTARRGSQAKPVNGSLR